MTTTQTSEQVHLIEVYCAGSPSRPHKREYVARMVRTLRVMDDSTGWTIAHDGGDDPHASNDDRDRFALPCPRAPGCRVNAQAVVDHTRVHRGYEQLVRGLDFLAAAAAREVSLHLLAGMVSRSEAR